MRLICTTTLDDFISAVSWVSHTQRTNATCYIPVISTHTSLAFSEFANHFEIEVLPWEKVAPKEDLQASSGLMATSIASDPKEFYLRCVRAIDTSENAEFESGCVYAANGPTVWVGVALALATRRSLVVFHNWQELFDNLISQESRSITIITSSTELIPAVVSQLARVSILHRIGVLTGRDLASVSFAVAKVIAYRQRGIGGAVTIVPDPSFAGGPAHDRRIALSDLTPEMIREFMSAPVDFFGVSTHGDNIDSNLGPALLCGLTHQKDPALIRDAQTCEMHGLCRRDPAGRLMRVPFNRLQARFVVLETCSGIGVANGIYPSALSQALSAIDGWAEALLSSVKVARDTLVAPMFVRAALKEGLSYGEVAQLFSRLQVTVTGDQPSYLLMGDADGCLTPHRCVQYQTVDWPTEAQGIDIRLHDITISFLIVIVKGAPGLTVHGEPLTVTFVEDNIPSKEFDPIFAGLMRDSIQTDLAVAVFSTAPLGNIWLRLESGAEKRNHAETEIAALERNVTHLRWFHDKAARIEGLRPTPELRRQACDLDLACSQGEHALLLLRALPSLVTRRLVARAEGRASENIVKMARAITQAADIALVEAIPAWRLPHHIAAFYDGFIEPDGVERSAGPCYICKCSTYEVDMVGRLRPDIARTITHCYRCAVISDRPKDMPFLSLIGPDRARPGDTISQEIQVLSNEVADLVIVSTLISENLPWFETKSDPTFRVGIPRPDARESVRFNLEIHPCALPGIYYIMAVTVSNLRLSVSSKPLCISLAND